MNISVVIGQPAEFECILKQRRDDLQKVELSPLAQTLSWMTIKSICERGRGRAGQRLQTKEEIILLLVLIFFFISSDRQVLRMLLKNPPIVFILLFPRAVLRYLLFL